VLARERERVGPGLSVPLASHHDAFSPVIRRGFFLALSLSIRRADKWIASEAGGRGGGRVVAVGVSRGSQPANRGIDGPDRSPACNR